MIRVIDDGSGMAQDDALLAFERHATSKLRTADDLLAISHARVRGEALPSIAAVSRLLLQTPRGEEEKERGSSLPGGKLVSVKPEGLPSGTTISVPIFFTGVPRGEIFSNPRPRNLATSLARHALCTGASAKQFVLRRRRRIINVTPWKRWPSACTSYLDPGSRELFEILPVSSPMRPAIHRSRTDYQERAAETCRRGFASRPDVQRSNRNGISSS